jgi:RNA methyltransferase, TrmH family
MITSSQNPLIKEIRRLRRDKQAREDSGLFVVEGIQGVIEALNSGAWVHAVVYAPDLLTSELALDAIATAEQRGVRCETVSTFIFQSLSERENPVGVLALVEQRLLALDALHPEPTGLYLALYNVSDPGNLGTIIRTMDAVGGNAIFLVGQTVDPFHPATVKASAGTIFSMPLLPIPDLEPLLEWCQRAGVAVVGTSDRATEEYWSVDYPLPLLLMMGSEAHGLPEEVLAGLPQTINIPMNGTADSLNLAVATALALYEVRRQRRASEG